MTALQDDGGGNPPPQIGGILSPRHHRRSGAGCPRPWLSSWQAQSRL